MATCLSLDPSETPTKISDFSDARLGQRRDGSGNIADDEGKAIAELYFERRLEISQEWAYKGEGIRRSKPLGGIESYSRNCSFGVYTGTWAHVIRTEEVEELR